VTGLDLTHRLARGPKTRTFLKMSDSDIAAKIAGEYGLDTDIDAVRETHEYVLQAGETDFAFLKRLCGRIGYDFWVSEKKFYFKHKPAGRAKPYQVRWGENLSRFSVRFASSDMCDEVVVKAWNPVDKRAVTGRATNGDLGTDAPAANDMVNAAKHAFGRVTRFAGQFPADSQAEADAVAASLLLRATGGAVILRGEATGNPWLGAGDEVALDRVGHEVLVGFELGDKTRPMILGGLWSRKDKPPQPDATQGGKTTLHLMASRKNHRVVLTDDPKSAVDLTLGDAQSALHLEKSESK